MVFERQMSGDAQVLRMVERLPLTQVSSISQRLMTLPEVDYAEPDAILQHTLIPNDPQYSSQWHYFAPSAGNYGINAPAAWDITTGSASIVAAVIDTGITNHADLSGRTVPGYDFINDVQVANDGNGRDNNPAIQETGLPRQSTTRVILPAVQSILARGTAPTQPVRLEPPATTVWV